MNLDFTPTFTPALLFKDFHLGFEAAAEHGVPMPVAAAAQQVVQALMGFGYDDVDFIALLEHEARGSWLELEPENVPVSDGLRSGRPRRGRAVRASASSSRVSGTSGGRTGPWAVPSSPSHALSCAIGITFRSIQVCASSDRRRRAPGRGAR